MSSTADRPEIEELFQGLRRAHAAHDADGIVEAYVLNCMALEDLPIQRTRWRNLPVTLINSSPDGCFAYCGRLGRSPGVADPSRRRRHRLQP